MNFNAFEAGTIIYTIYFLLLVVACYWSFSKPKEETKSVFVFFMVILCLIGGLRSQVVGADTGTYVMKFEVMKGMSIPEVFFIARAEPFCAVVLHIISEPFNTYAPAFLITFAIFTSLIGYSFYKCSNNPLLSLACFIILGLHLFLMSAMRQGFALCIVLFAYSYLKKDKVILFSLLVLLAALFHTSAIICLLLVLVRNIKFYNKPIKMLIFFSSCLIVVASLDQIPLLNDYDVYLNGEEELHNLRHLIMSILFFIYMLISVNGKELDKEGNLLFNISMLYVIFSVSSIYINIAYRVAYYFEFIVPIFMAYMVKRRDSLSFLLFCFVILHIVVGIPPYVDNYQFFWQDPDIANKLFK